MKMSNQIWWKPGSEKPSGKRSKKKEKTASNPLDSLGTSGGNKKSSGNCDQSGITQLSSGTRNMRFMQRKQQRQQDHATQIPKNPTTPQKVDDNMHFRSPTDLDCASMEVDHEIFINYDSKEVQSENDSAAAIAKRNASKPPLHDTLIPHNLLYEKGANDISLVDIPQQATPTDMFGPEASIILGRRSFGGFNKHVAENWYISSLSAKVEDKKNERITDDELLKRYDKVMRNSAFNSSKSDKKNDRKGGQKNQMISNSSKKKKRDLDEYLKNT